MRLFWIAFIAFDLGFVGVSLFAIAGHMGVESALFLPVLVAVLCIVFGLILRATLLHRPYSPRWQDGPGLPISARVHIYAHKPAIGAPFGQTPPSDECRECGSPEGSPHDPRCMQRGSIHG